MCDCPNDHDLFRFIDDQIDAGRWAISGVGVGPPRQLKWLYTIGLSERFSHPELVVVGVCCGPCGGGILNRLGDRVAAGERFDAPSTAPIDLGGVLVYLRPVPAECWHADWFAVWRAYYRSKPFDPPPADAMQVVWADAAGRFPSELGSTAPAQEMHPAGSRRRRRVHR